MPVAATDPAAPFDDARTALFWSVEVLRRRRQPQLSAIWRDLPASRPDAETGWEEDLVRPFWRSRLPGTAQERYDLALSVMNLVEGLDGASGRRPGHGAALLLEQAWGDGVSEARLRTALAMQEKLRRQGVRMLINYRYTFRQLGEMHGVDAKTIWSRTRKALTRLDAVLAAKGLVWVPQREKA